MLIRVAYIDHTALLSGGEIALLNLVAHLDRAVVEPVVILFEDGPLAVRLRAINVETHIVHADVTVLQTRKDSLGIGSLMRAQEAIASLRQALRVRRVLRRLKVDIVHTNSLKSDLIGGLAGRLARKWVIWHVRDRIEPDYLPTPVVRVFRLLARWIPHHVIANSHSTLETLHLGRMRKRRQSVVYSGVVIHDGTPMPAMAAGRSLTDADEAHPPTVGLIGRITRWKGQDVLLRAAALLKQRGVRARYRIIGAPLFGEEAYEQELRAAVHSLGIADLVEFAGFRADVQGELATLDLVVHTSITPEPFGQVVVEGMAAGKPVIATRAGGVVEIIEHGVSGLLVPPRDVDALADALASVLANPARAAELGVQGRARVQACFTIDRVARDAERLYRSLAEPQPQSSRAGARDAASTPA